VERVRRKYGKAYNTAVTDGDPDPAFVAKKASMGVKKRLPALTLSGRFRMRSETGITEHSGILCLDIDNCLELEKVNSSPHVRSPTGAGIKASIRIQPDSGLSPPRWSAWVRGGAGPQGVREGSLW
jgi:BT4734-like, N-terminal domain